MAGRRRASAYVLAALIANTVFVGLQSLLLAPLLIRSAGAQLYGAWLASGDVLSWMLVSDLGIPNLLVQRIGAADARGEGGAAGRWLAAGLVVVALLATVVATVGLIVAGRLPAMFDLAGADAATLTRAFRIASLGTAASLPFTTIYGYGRAIQRTGLLATASVVATVLGFASAFVLAWGGAGPEAIAVGIAVRAAVLLATGIAFIALATPAAVRDAMRLDRTVLRELLRLTPMTALAGFAYAAMNQSELLVASLALGPAAATVYMVNRRAMDLGRSIADSVSFAVYGGFSHLASSSERHRSLFVYWRILALRTTLSVGIAVAFIALNERFIALWVGAANYRGLVLTVAIATQAIVAGNGFLVNSLLRATGADTLAPALFVAEAVIRVLAMFIGARMFGLDGLVIGATAVALAFVLVAHRVFAARCRSYAAPAAPIASPYWLAASTLLAVGVVAARQEWRASWVTLTLAGGLAAVATTTLLVLLSPHLRELLGSRRVRQAG